MVLLMCVDPWNEYLATLKTVEASVFNTLQAGDAAGQNGVCPCSHS